MAYKYDEENIFAKILRGEIPNETILENDHALAFRDINPQRPHHVLVIPKGKFVSFDHFAKEASPIAGCLIHIYYVLVIVLASQSVKMLLPLKEQLKIMFLQSFNIMRITG
jgi:galactose-1-phosphate uridylyltransferase